jgi:hypothetical protein
MARSTLQESPLMGVFWLMFGTNWIVRAKLSHLQSFPHVLADMPADFD